MRSFFFCVLSAPLLLAQSPDAKEDLKNPVAGPGGGPTGGGRGPNLAKGEQIRSATNRHLVSVVTEGVKGSDMPPSGLPPEKVWRVIAYLRNMTAVAFDSMGAGNAPSGKTLFFGKAGCANCHTVRG